jgi:hypothetical protein
MTAVGVGYALIPPRLRDRLAERALRAEQTVDQAARDGYERRVADLLGPM